MKSVVDKQDLETSAREALDRRLENLDAATLSRLRQARQQAVATANRAPRVDWWLTAGAVATAVVIASISVTLFLPVPVKPIPDWLVQQEPDVEMLVSTEDLDFYQELEFLLWLDQRNHES
jgi:hypothetical protein